MNYLYKIKIGFIFLIFCGSVIGKSVIKTDTTIEPVKFTLHQNYPNPFNPTTTIAVSLPENAKVSLKIFDIIGNEVTTVYSGDIEAGNHSFIFDGKKLSSGTYFYKFSAIYGGRKFITVKKMTLLK